MNACLCMHGRMDPRGDPANACLCMYGRADGSGMDLVSDHTVWKAIRIVKEKMRIIEQEVIIKERSTPCIKTSPSFSK